MPGNSLLCLAVCRLILKLRTVSIGPHSFGSRSNSLFLFLESNSAGGCGGVPILFFALFNLASKLDVQSNELKRSFLCYILHSVVGLTLIIVWPVSIIVLHERILLIDPHHWHGGIWTTKLQSQYFLFNVDILRQVQTTLPNYSVLTDVLDL